jgi:hypothetical protein
MRFTACDRSSEQIAAGLFAAFDVAFLPARSTLDGAARGVRPQEAFEH